MPRGTSDSSAAARESSSGVWNKQAVQGLSGNLELPSIAQDGSRRRGNTTGEAARAIFKPDATGAFPPVFVGHRLGYVVGNFTVTSQNGAGSIYVSKTRRPTRSGLWIEIANTVGTDPVTVEGRMDGPRRQGP